MLSITIVGSLAAMISVMALQISLSKANQIKLADHRLIISGALEGQIEKMINQLSSEFDLKQLPLEQTLALDSLNQETFLRRSLVPIRSSKTPPSGFSLNSQYKTLHIELTDQATARAVQTNRHITGLGCSWTTDGTLSNTAQDIYSIDYKDDLETDLSYKFDADTGSIWRRGTQDQLLMQLDLDEMQTFSVADFVILKSGELTKVAIIFAIERSDSVTQTQENQLLIVLDELSRRAEANLPLTINHLIDLSTNPDFSINKAGYKLTVAAGDLIVAAITSFNKNVIFINQSPRINSNFDKINYINRLYRLSLADGRPVMGPTTNLTNSNDKLRLSINTTNQSQAIISNQYAQQIISLPGSCAVTYQYET